MRSRKERKNKKSGYDGNKVALADSNSKKKCHHWRKEENKKDKCLNKTIAKIVQVPAEKLKPKFQCLCKRCSMKGHKKLTQAQYSMSNY